MLDKCQNELKIIQRSIESVIGRQLKGTGFTRKGVGKYAIDDVSSFISQSSDKKYSDVVLRLQRAETYVIFSLSFIIIFSFDKTFFVTKESLNSVFDSSVAAKQPS